MQRLRGQALSLFADILHRIKDKVQGFQHPIGRIGR